MAAAAQPTELEDLGAAARGLGQALEEGADDATIDAQIEALAVAIDALEASAAELAEAEMALQQEHYGVEPGVAREGLGPYYYAFVLTVTAFAGYLKMQSDAMQAAQGRRDEAYAREDFEAVQQETENIARAGTQAVEAIANKLIPNPVDTIVSTTPVGTLLVQAAGSAEDLTTLVSTAQCAEDPMAEDCRIAAHRGASGQVPAGAVQVYVTGARRARAVIDQVLIREGETTTLAVNLPEIGSLGAPPPADSFRITVYPFNQTQWGPTPIQAHILVEDETMSAGTLLGPLEAREVSLLVTDGQLIRFHAYDASGQPIADTHCEAKDFHAAYDSADRIEELQVPLRERTSGFGLHCELDWLSPRSP